MNEQLDLLDIDSGSSAVISDDGLYRYRLDRWWAADSPGYTRMPIMMCNPSTADWKINDPTVRRCIGFAKDRGLPGITVVNTGAFRSTDPKVWAAAEDPFGPENIDHVVEVVVSAGYVVAAWGSNPMAVKAGSLYLERFREHRIGVYCLGTTKDGHPRHPLYVRRDQPLVRYPAA